MEEKLKGDYGTPDQTKITDDDVMCRTCFSNYERYAKAREVIDEAIKGFMKFECEPELGPPYKSGKVTVSFHCSVYTPGITLTTIIWVNDNGNDSVLALNESSATKQSPGAIVSIAFHLR